MLTQIKRQVELLATPAGPERALIFKTGLGNSQVLQARLINYSKTKVDYTSKTDSNDFHVEKNTQPATSGGVGGTEVTIEVTFEPSQLGDSKGTLIVSSGYFFYVGIMLTEFLTNFYNSKYLADKHGCGFSWGGEVHFLL